MNALKSLAPLIISLSLITGCLPARIHGGSVSHSGPMSRTILTQSDDPKNASTIDQNSERTIETVLPAGSRLNLESNVFVTLNQPTPFKSTVRDVVKTSNGAAQENTLGATIAKLRSLAWLTWLGAALILFGIASAAYPPVKLIVNSLTTSALLVVAGVAFIALPSLLVGHELAILLIGGGVCVCYFFAHRHGGVSAELKLLKDKFTNTEGK